MRSFKEKRRPKLRGFKNTRIMRRGHKYNPTPINTPPMHNSTHVGKKRKR